MVKILIVLKLVINYHNIGRIYFTHDIFKIIPVTWVLWKKDENVFNWFYNFLFFTFLLNHLLKYILPITFHHNIIIICSDNADNMYPTTIVMQKVQQLLTLLNCLFQWFLIKFFLSCVYYRRRSRRKNLNWHANWKKPKSWKRILTGVETLYRPYCAVTWRPTSTRTMIISLRWKLNYWSTPERSRTKYNWARSNCVRSKKLSKTNINKI